MAALRWRPIRLLVHVACRRSRAGSVWVYRREVGQADWLLFGLSCDSSILNRAWLWELKFERALHDSVVELAPEA